jgi:hypothetical protein
MEELVKNNRFCRRGTLGPSFPTRSPLLFRSSRTFQYSDSSLTVFPGNEQHPDAGWSSPVAREAHNLEVVGSNPTPAISRPPCPHGQGGLFLRGAVPRPVDEFFDVRARRIPQIYEFDSQHADGIRYTDVTEGERVLNEIIYECQRSLEVIGHAKLDLESRSWARGQQT